MNIIGKLLNNRYEVLENVGNGGMAYVYKAKDQVLNRYVAIKVLKDEFTTDSEFIKKFNSEAQSAARLQHPNIVQIYDVCNEENLYYIVMELIQGKTLKEIIQEDGKLSWKWSINIAIQIASALETAHKNNIIHRDIKPHNIIITEDGIAKVTDFGIAKAVSNSTITAFGTTIGSVHYFSPEHARGGYTDAKSDIYSLGIVMYEMLTGRVPFDADTPVSVALKQVQEEPVEPIRLNPDIPISVNRIILKAMQKDPNMRYQTATDMLKDLSISLKRPDEDFVDFSKMSSDSPTQKIPTIYDIGVENSNGRRAASKEENKKENKVKAFYSKHKWALPVTVILVAIILFFLALNITKAVVDSNKVAEAILPDVAQCISSDERMTKDDAVKALNELGFTNIEIKEEYSDDVEEGYVISQNPSYKENFKRKVDEKVTLVISKGQKMVTLPKKMVGKNISEVKEALDELEVKYEITEKNDEKIEKDIVMEVDQKEGSEISAATTVNITVSIGSQYKDVTMPSLIGQSESTAVSTIQSLNLTANVSYEENASKSDGVVISQSVSGGQTTKEGTTINIIVNKQPKQATVTVNVNLKSLVNYTEPVAENVTTVTNDVNGTEVQTTTTKTPEVPSSTVVISVGDDVVFNEKCLQNKTNISQTWTTTGVKEVKVKVDGVTKYTATVDFSKGDQVLNVK